MCYLIPSSVISIGSGAFSLNLLTEVTFNEGLDDIGISAFQSNNITSLDFQ